MDTKALDAAIKKQEKKIDQHEVKIKALEKQIAGERNAIKDLRVDLKKMQALKKKQEEFEASFSASLADLFDDGKSEKKSEEPKSTPAPQPARQPIPQPAQPEHGGFQNH